MTGLCFYFPLRLEKPSWSIITADQNSNSTFRSVLTLDSSIHPCFLGVITIFQAFPSLPSYNLNLWLPSNWRPKFKMFWAWSSYLFIKLPKPAAFWFFLQLNVIRWIEELSHGVKNYTDNHVQTPSLETQLTFDLNSRLKNPHKSYHTYQKEHKLSATLFMETFLWHCLFGDDPRPIFFFVQFCPNIKTERTKTSEISVLSGLLQFSCIQCMSSVNNSSAVW